MKILVISNACFAKADSNGRTLANLFSSFDKKQLAQLFVYGEPDFSVCENYYKVSDRDALNSLIRMKAFGGQAFPDESNSDTSSKAEPVSRNTDRIKKTPLSRLIRELVWSLGFWKRKFYKWVDEFSPDAIFVFLGDNAFTCNIATKIAKKKKIPIYACSTENYVFKDYNYISGKPSVFYWCFHSMLKRTYKRMEKYVKCGIFNTPLLAEIYEKEYSYPCKCIFNSSNVEFIENAEISTPLRVSYLGNLGVNRHIPLVEIANTLAELFPGTKLDIYGALPDDLEAKNALLSCKNIDYKGFVSYDDVVRIIHESTLVVHAEYDDDYYNKELQYAFSTKIADSVCSGTPFLIYANRSFAGTDFICRNNCAFVAHTSDELKQVLKNALTDVEMRKKVLENAKATREQHLTQKDALYRVIHN